MFFIIPAQSVFKRKRLPERLKVNHSAEAVLAVDVRHPTGGCKAVDEDGRAHRPWELRLRFCNFAIFIL